MRQAMSGIATILTRALAVLVVSVLLDVRAQVQAHEVRPAYLELRESGTQDVNILFRVPARGALRLDLQARFPETCRTLAPVVTERTEGAFVERWTVACADGLAGRSVLVEGLRTTITDVLVRVERADGTAQMARLTPDAPSLRIDPAASWTQVAGSYLRLGAEHILLGVDHLLFVLALMLLVEGWRRLLETITAFTVAHSLTLAAATLGVVHIPQRPVEATIALSIVFVALEIVHARQGRPGLAQRWPWMVAFAFGLLHGLGFAGALSDVGLPGQAVPLALLFFNIGVEAGQILFVAAALGVLAIVRRLERPASAWMWRLPAYGIGGVAAFWTIERVAGF